MEDFVVELAETPVRIRCRFEENRRFLRDYLSDKEPLFTVEPTADDLARMQTDVDQMDRTNGRRPRPRPEYFLENNAIHALLAEGLVKYDALLTHGSTLCMDGQAYVFTAPSGTGKSSHSSLWRKAFGDRVWMVNDDKPLLRIKEDGVAAFGTPWDGKSRLSRNASAPLKAVVWLTRDVVNHIEPMSRAAAFPILMSQCFASKIPATMKRIVELEKTLLNAAEFYKLGCNLDPEAAIVAYEGMNAR